MTWQIELSRQAEKNLDQLDKPIAQRILSFLFERVAPLDDPRSLERFQENYTHIQLQSGSPLTGVRVDFERWVPRYTIPGTAVGEALKGSRFGDLWRYRVGDYRIVCAIEDEILRVLAVKIGNRREVYR